MSRENYADKLHSALETLVKETQEARKHARLAYEFVPNSYTFAAMSQPSRALDEAATLLAQIQRDDSTWSDK